MVVTWGPIRLKNGSQDVHSLFPARCDYALFHRCGPCNHTCPHKREGNVKTEARRHLKMLLDLNIQMAPGAKDIKIQLYMLERERQSISPRALEVGCGPVKSMSDL